MPATPLPSTANGQNKCPSHVAIIMDGNGRWAKARSFPRVAGHKKGADALREIMNGCRDAGVTHLTIYAFSSENWNRPAVEVNDLMQLLKHYLSREITTLHKNGIRLRIIGDKSKLSEDIRQQIADAEKLTENNSSFYFNVAISYGSRQELTQAMQSIAMRIAKGELKPEEVTEECICAELYTSCLPDPDLLIRTGGEQRLSNFLLWQSAYTELYFTPVLWPDFTVRHLQEALTEYANRERRYGNTAG